MEYVKCSMSMDKPYLKKLLGRDITQKEFSDFCKEAVLSKLLEEQLRNSSAHDVKK